MSKGPTATIDEGFDRPFVAPERTDRIDPVAETGTSKPSRTAEGSPGEYSSPLAGFDIDGGTDSGTDNDSRPRKRGRPPGSRNKGTAGPVPINEAKTVQADLGDLESLLLSVHLMGAQILKVPELELDPAECRKLSHAIKGVLKHYPLYIDPKKMAIAQLVFVAGGIYGSRAIAIARSHKKEPPAKVITMDTPARPAPAPAPGQPLTKPLSETTPSEIWNEPGGVIDNVD
jgi:hypothetical protein